MITRRGYVAVAVSKTGLPVLRVTAVRSVGRPATLGDNAIGEHVLGCARCGTRVRCPFKIVTDSGTDVRVSRPCSP